MTSVGNLLEAEHNTPNNYFSIVNINSSLELQLGQKHLYLPTDYQNVFAYLKVVYKPIQHGESNCPRFIFMLWETNNVCRPGKQTSPTQTSEHHSRDTVFNACEETANIVGVSSATTTEQQTHIHVCINTNLEACMFEALWLKFIIIGPNKHFYRTSATVASLFVFYTPQTTQVLFCRKQIYIKMVIKKIELSK